LSKAYGKFLSWGFSDIFSDRLCDAVCGYHYHPSTIEVPQEKAKINDFSENELHPLPGLVSYLYLPAVVRKQGNSRIGRTLRNIVQYPLPVFFNLHHCSQCWHYGQEKDQKKQDGIQHHGNPGQPHLLFLPDLSVRFAQMGIDVKPASGPGI
jgi:hypothetical protein